MEFSIHRIILVAVFCFAQDAIGDGAEWSKVCSAAEKKRIIELSENLAKNSDHNWFEDSRSWEYVGGTNNWDVIHNWRAAGGRCYAIVALRSEASGDVVIPDRLKFDGEWHKVALIGVKEESKPTLVTGLSGGKWIEGCYNRVFAGCDALTSVEISGLRVLGRGVFEGSATIKSVSLPKAERLMDDAFRGCSTIESVSLPEVFEVGNGAFKDCVALSSIQLPFAQLIGDNVFEGCVALVSGSLPKARRVGASMFRNCKSLSSVSFPKATWIGPNAFRDCPSLADVSLPKATWIDAWAFEGCSGIRSFVLEDSSVLNARFSAFPTNAIALTTQVSFQEDCPMWVTRTKMRSYNRAFARPEAKDNDFRWFEDSQSWEYVGGLENWKIHIQKNGEASVEIRDMAFEDVVVPDRVKVEGEWRKVTRIATRKVFVVRGEQSEKKPPQAVLTGVSGGRWVRNVSWGAFHDCAELRSVSLPNVTDVELGAFSELHAITSISLPKATRIGQHTFWECRKLSTLELPQATSICSDAFLQCRALKNLVLGDYFPLDAASVKLPKKSALTLTVPQSSYDKWLAWARKENERGYNITVKASPLRTPPHF